MKLDNVDVAKLQLADLPKFNQCPCELCDDGCFDRAGNQHHPECQRRLPQRSNLSQAARCPLSHYKGTFLAATTISGGPADHRRHACAPPPDNEIPTSFKNVPMSGVTSQKDHYQAPPVGTVKPKAATPAKQTDNVILSRAVPMETQTHYQVEFVEKPVVPVSFRALKDPQISITEPSAPLSSQTTTRAHFKSWQPAPSQPYSEMPSVAGHVLFPNSTRVFDTTTSNTFVPFTNITQTKPVVRLDHHGNLKISGSMDLRTNYRQDYNTPELPAKSETPSKTKDQSTEQKVYTRRPMNGISQTSFDFRPYSKQRRPPPPAEMEPFLSQFSIGNMRTSVEKESQYRLDYPGHNTNQHPRQAAAAPKDHQQPYKPPTQKMDTLTVSQRDFQPIDITALPRIRLVPIKSSLSVNDQKGPMESVTMSRYHYQPHEPTVSKRRYGELVPNLYVAPMEKFQGTTTTGETFQGRAGQPARAFIPEVKTLNRAGEQDHTTNYRVDYQPHGLSLCAARAYAIAQNKETTATPITAQ